MNEEVVTNEVTEAAVEAVEQAAEEAAVVTEEAEAAAEPLESMDDYQEELEKSFKKASVGDVLTGTVASVTDDEVIVDLDYSAPGVISKANFSNDPNLVLADAVSVGDVITAKVVRSEDRDGNIVLSRKEANEVMFWEKMTTMMEEKTMFPVTIDSAVKAGVVAYVEGVRGFITASKLDIGYVENLEEWVGKEVDVIVITADTQKKRLVLSAREGAREKAKARKAEQIAALEVGTVLTGTVDSLMNYGAFIKLENGLSGLLHVSQISRKRVETPASVLKEGQEVTVKVIGVKDGKISLSMKALEEPTGEREERPRRERGSREKDPEKDTYGYKETGKAATSLGDLLSGIKLD